MEIIEKEDKFLAGEFEGNIFIKLIGNSTMRNSKTLEEYLNKILTGEKKDIILDFEECNYMDSTMLGLIAKIALKIKKIWLQEIIAINLDNS
ncbi:MAG: STAS domain-containing protein, partial [Fusobacteria bacterium]|nr:STAS domain-containing protein [Fusobacteriota bacterium]